MKTTRKSIKRTLLVGLLALMTVLTGCSSEKKPDTNENQNSNVVEEDPNELTEAEVKALKVGDVVPEGKKVNRALLEDQGMDLLYEYKKTTVYTDKHETDMLVYITKEIAPGTTDRYEHEEITEGDILRDYSTYEYSKTYIGKVKYQGGKKYVISPDGNLMFESDIIDEKNIESGKQLTK